MDQTELSELHDLLPGCLRRDRLRIEERLRRSARVGHGQERVVTALLNDARRSVRVRHRRHELLPQVSYPESLPIVAKKDEILAAIKANQVVVIAGETGSGKTTQIPKICLEAGIGVEGKIGCTQPRRVAALSISRRIAEELNVPWGQGVGSKIRFSDQTSPESYIKVMTDGILLAEMQADPDLNEYEAIIIDEAHERSLNIDFLLGHLKQILPRRPDLKVVITSATIDTEAFSAAFGGAPVIEVSGRLYPVEIRYMPIDPECEETGDMTYIDAAVEAVDGVLDESHAGDVLIFMPGERDIRETQDDLVGRYSHRVDILPLFGRLTSAEQDRVFAAGARRKIIIATNIAETSLTLPGIRYVIDTGLGRISRYSPRTRTKRLPVEPVAQSSANQRAGRSGRVQNGVCIRLYSEEDFNARPKFAQPEIQRANLAEVILRMKAFRLGEIETFPFINPPQPQAVKSGYQLLHELGAIGEERNLTALGRDLARLPVDPAIGRMVLQSVREDALEEVLVIAAGLSIQDPRERPLDREEAANEAHRKFVDPDSDFLALLNIWNAYHDQWESFKTQNQVRKFCKANFLSYQRMREWRDVHAQLSESLREALDLKRPNTRQSQTTGEMRKAGAARGAQRADGWKSSCLKYAAIHRSVLAGLLGHIAQRVERNLYRAAGNREVVVFPGSALSLRQPAKRETKSLAGLQQTSNEKNRSSQPEWIMAGEFVETSRLYARTLARIAPEWIAELGEHVCRRSYSDARWDSKAGRVLAQERTTLFGFQVQELQVAYGRINPKQATEIFIRSALIDDPLKLPHRFLKHNEELRQRAEVLRTRTRDHSFPDPDEALFAFYAKHLENVSSVHDLNRVVRERVAEDVNFLCVSEADLAGGKDLSLDREAFPSELNVAGQRVSVRYAYSPGEEGDGATFQVPAGLAHAIEPGTLDWIIPGLREEQVEHLLKSLPKSLRVPLMPIAPKAKELAAELEPGSGLDGLRQLIRQRYGIDLPATSLSWEQAPDYLRPRVAVLTKEGKTVVAGRDLARMKAQLKQHETPAEQQAWALATQRFERYQVSGWSFEVPAEQIEISHAAGQPLYAFPGLQADEHGVHLRLFRTRSEAAEASRGGLARLAELALQRELGWIEKDLRALDKFKDLYVTLGPGEELTASALANVRAHAIQLGPDVLPLSKPAFDSLVERARERLRGIAPRLIDATAAILRLRQEILLCKRPYPAMRADLDALLPRRFLETIPFERLAHIPRYLKAMLIRAERAAHNPLKDQERARQIQPYAAIVQQLRSAEKKTDAARRAASDFRWMVEEFKVSVFAQELGTAEPVSAKRLDQRISELRNADLALRI